MNATREELFMALDNILVQLGVIQPNAELTGIELIQAAETYCKTDNEHDVNNALNRDYELGNKTETGQSTALPFPVHPVPPDRSEDTGRGKVDRDFVAKAEKPQPVAQADGTELTIPSHNWLKEIAAIARMFRERDIAQSRYTWPVAFQAGQQQATIAERKAVGAFLRTRRIHYTISSPGSVTVAFSGPPAGKAPHSGAAILITDAELDSLESGKPPEGMK